MTTSIDYEALFDAAPTPYLVLSPDLVVVGMNRAREEVAGRRREEVIGKELFEAFPDPPGDERASGVRNLRASLERVLATRRPDTMPVQQYDLLDPETGEWVERWWSPVNVPVLDDDGEVVWLVHRVTEVTEWMQLRKRRQQATDPTLDESDSDLYTRAQELHTAWMQASSDVEHFRVAMQSQRIIGQAVGLLMAKLGVDAEGAFALLAKESQYSNTKLRDVAAQHVARHTR
ncbi:ANTAR domain-containing protein [Desertihabitans brevis]|uniref:ANTAR domain-containing protein n=1 Tax=Desertihabitans brevis TaxID=2268447 RepID=A0A367YVB6_9ACTN|nr:ANTAR domain-containing protein [Desertihabitans brevis]RCK69479.1 ANTAR domain-containing protein [Desertihabitans brevis]